MKWVGVEHFNHLDRDLDGEKQCCAGYIDVEADTGVIVEDCQPDCLVHRIVAPIIAPLLMRDIGSNALVARLPQVPFRTLPGGTLDLQTTMLELLPFLNLEAL